MAKPKCTPLKITAILTDGRLNSADGVVMLDSILYHAWFIKYAPDVLEGVYSHGDGYIGLPLRQLPGNRWAASKGVYEEISQEVEHFVKRPDFFAGDKYDHLNMKKGLISDSIGKFRAYRVPQIIRIVKDGIITFWAIGHKREVQELLDLMLNVGKKSAIGYGKVAKWIVEDCEEDYTVWHPEHGLMRPIPVEEAEEKLKYPTMMYGVKPPYWKDKNQRLCYVPIR